MAGAARTTGAIGSAFRNCRLLLVQVFANPVIFLLFMFWLLLPVADVMQVALNAAYALVLVAAALTLHGGTLNYFQSDAGDVPLKDSFCRALRNGFAILIWVAIFYGLWILLDRLDPYTYSFPSYMRSEMPAVIRRHISQNAVDIGFNAALFALRWILLPGILLPFIARAARIGFSVFRPREIGNALRAMCSCGYWLAFIAASLIGVLAPGKIMNATPNFDTSTFRWEAGSLSLRLLAAYILSLAAWMAICSVVGRRSAAVGGGDSGGGNSAA